jgi:hypothetical protein
VNGGLSVHEILDDVASHSGAQSEFTPDAVGLDNPEMAEPVDVRCTP